MNADQSTLRNQKSASLWLIIPALLLIAILAFDWLPVLRGNAEWRWPLRALESPARVLIPGITLGLYVFGCALWLKGFGRETLPRGYERWFLVFVVIAAPVIQLALAFAVSRTPLLEFFGPTVSVHNSGYFTTAVATPDLDALLANFPAQMPQLPIHVQSHPPGPIVAQWLSWQGFQAWPSLAETIAMPLRTLQCHNPSLMALDNPQMASASLGMLLPLLGGLAVLPLYALGRRITSLRAAATTVMLFTVLPLFALWTSQWDQVYPLCLFLGLYLTHTGLEKNSWQRLLLAGVPLSIASFFSIGNFVLIALVALYSAMWFWLQRRSPRLSVARFLRLTIIFVLGCASVWLLYWLLYRVNPLSVISTGSRLAFESTTGNRSYGLWLLGNPIDFGVFLGFPIAILLLYNLLRRLPFPRTLWPITIATVSTLLLLWLSGIVRGEVGRLWMYFGPLVVLIVIGWQESGIHRQDETHSVPRISMYTLLIALMAVQLLVMNTRWLVNDSFLDSPPERVVILKPPAASFTTPAAFANQMALRGYDARSVNHAVDMNLVWQALNQPPYAYTVFVHVIDAAGRQVGQQDNMPVHNQLPTSCWMPGEYINDPYTIQLAAGAQPPFRLEVGVYRSDLGTRLPRSDAPGDSVILDVP